MPRDRLTYEEYGRIMGQWEAFNRVLNWINTQEDRLVDKHAMYRAVSAMRPRRGT